MELRLMLTCLGLVALAACDRGGSIEPSASARPSPSSPQASIDSTCSSPEASILVKDMITEGVESKVREVNKGIPNDRRIDLGKVRALAHEVRFELQDVMTAKGDPNSTKKFCEAQLVMRVPSDTVDVADRQRRERGQPRIQVIAEDENFKVDLDKFSTRVDYSVQPTDDGKKLYLILENAGRIQGLATDIIAFAALNTHETTPARTSIQDAAHATPVQQSPVAPAVVGGDAGSTKEAATATVAAAAAAAEEAAKQTLSGQHAELAASTGSYERAEREINLVWKALPKEVRDQHLPAQRAFNAEKESVCFKEANAAGEGVAFEIAKNKCWTRFYQRRIPELRALGVG